MGSWTMESCESSTNHEKHSEPQTLKPNPAFAFPAVKGFMDSDLRSRFLEVSRWTLAFREANVCGGVCILSTRPEVGSRGRVRT